MISIEQDEYTGKQLLPVHHSRVPNSFCVLQLRSAISDCIAATEKNTVVEHSRKEVFQPHLPVRLPCYDLAPVTSFTLGRSSR